MTAHDRPREPGNGQQGATDAPVDEAAPETVWAFDDPDATWWDDVWPFRDDSAETSGVIRPLAAAPTPAEETAAKTPKDKAATEPEPEQVPGAWAAAGAGGEVPWWMRRGVLVSALAAAAFVVAGLDVLGAGHTSDDPALLLKSPGYVSPVALHPGTSYLRSRVLASGDLVVTQWIRTRKPVGSLEVGAPLTLGLTAGSVQLSDLVLVAGGREYAVSHSAATGSTTRTFRFPSARDFYLHYRLSGAVEATGPGRRALARITSLDVVTGARTVPTTQVVVGAKVLALACTSGPPDSTPVPCGKQLPHSWSVRLAAARQPTRVMAQVDLS